MGRGRSIGLTRSGIAGTLLLAALLLGGGGRPHPGAELALQLLFAAGITAWLLVPISGFKPPRSAGFVAATLLAVVLLHLAPLPPDVWTRLPDRAPIIAALELIGQEPDWRPLSIAPSRTVGAVLSLIPALTMMLMATMLNHRARRGCFILVGTAGLLCVAVGLIQLVVPQATLYADAHPGWLTGLFANRNAAADLLAIAALFWGMLARAGRHRRQAAWPMRLAQMTCVAGLLATGSRAGIAMLIVVAAVELWSLRGRYARYARIVWLGGAVAIGAVVAALVLSPLGTRVAPRFADFTDARPDLWRDSWSAAQAFWPTGAGIGAFVPAFLLHERPEMIDASYPNRAHNDYLEFLVEAGALAPLVVAAVLFCLGRAGWQSWQGRPDHRGQILATAAALCIIALHSIVDYPLRTMALSCLTGFCAGCLWVPAPRRAEVRTDRKAAAQGREE